MDRVFYFFAIATHQTAIATHLKSNRDCLFSQNTLNVQSDRPLIRSNRDRNSSQIKLRSPISIIKNQQGDRTNNLYTAIMSLMKFKRVWL
jgi:hypothetical protein